MAPNSESGHLKNVAKFKDLTRYTATTLRPRPDPHYRVECCKKTPMNYVPSKGFLITHEVPGHGYFG